MNQIFESLVSYLADNWPELVWIVMAAGLAAYFASRRSYFQWAKREFLNRLNVSLTYVEDGTLKIRTMLEMDVAQVFLNASAAKRLVILARQTTDDNPLIPLPKEDCWYYLNAVLNEISERYSLGHLKCDLGLPVTRARYIICLTCETAGTSRTHKIRAMLVRKDLLENLPNDQPHFESPTHMTRWNTLYTLAKKWKQQPESFLELELAI